MAKNEIISYIEELAEQKKVSTEIVFLAIEDAMKKAYEKEMSSEDLKHPEYSGSKCEVHIDRTTGALTVEELYTVLDDAVVPDDKDKNGDIITDSNDKPLKAYNSWNEILLSEVEKIKPGMYKAGDIYHKPVELAKLPKRVVLHMLQVFKHDINIESNKTVYKEWIDRKGTIIYAEVEKIDSRNRSIVVNLESTYGVVSRMDQNPDETLIEGAKYKFYIKDVLEQSKNWPIVLSRASGEIVKDLLTTYIPEINSGAVSIVKVGRAAGFKTKVAVKSNQPGVDAIGACIGARADRIKPILSEMGNEKIEFVEYSEDINKYLVNACNPAPLIGFNIIEPTYEENAETGEKKELTRKKYQLIVDDYKLALIIGSKGKNVRVLSELLDADVEVVTYDEAIETGMKYTKAEVIRKAYVPGPQQKPVTNKFHSTYNKYFNTNDNVINTIDKTNEIVDDATIVPEEPIVQSGEAVVAEDYSEGLGELDQILSGETNTEEKPAEENSDAEKK